jgi:hypothetical protein
LEKEDKIMTNKKRLGTALAVGAVAMAFLMGASAVQAAPTVVFEPGTDRANAINNLKVGSTLYNVTFDIQTTAFEVYGEFPGTYTFPNEDAAGVARDAVVDTLNDFSAFSIGEPGLDQDFFTFNVGFNGFVGPGDVLFVETQRAAMGGPRWVSLGKNQWTYLADERNYASFEVVPIPGAVWLLGGGLIGLLGLRKRFKS